MALALGLMAKAMLVTLPFVLLLLDYWPLERTKSEIRNPKSENTRCGATGSVVSRVLNSFRISDFGFRIFEKLPLFGLAAGAAVVTWLAQQGGGAIESFEQYPLGARIGNGVVSYVRYVGMMLWPGGLAVFYPHPGAGFPLWQPIAAALLLVVVTGLAVKARRTRPYLLVGW